MISVKINNTGVNAKLAKQQKLLAQLPNDSIRKFKDLTPVRSGNARSRTNLSSNAKQIVGNYSYATKLDQGYSKQAPSGMTKPFAVWFKQQLKKITGK